MCIGSCGVSTTGRRRPIDGHYDFVMDENPYVAPQHDEPLATPVAPRPMPWHEVVQHSVLTLATVIVVVIGVCCVVVMLGLVS